MDGPMICPECGGEMVAGTLTIRGTVAGFFLFGAGRQHLFWTGVQDTAASPEQLIRSGGYCDAYRCASCGTVAFRPSVDEAYV